MNNLPHLRCDLRRLLIAIAALCAGFATNAGPAQGTLMVTKAWSRATPPGTSVGAAYFDIVNAGAADTLDAITTPLAARVEMHATSMQGGVMQMQQVQHVAVPARGTVEFSPLKLHAMLLELKAPLVAGTPLPLTLQFHTAGRIEVSVRVLGFGASGPGR